MVRNILLFVMTTFLLLSCQDKGRKVSGGGHIQMDEERYDFGVLNASVIRVAQHNFVLTNDGAEPLVIASVQNHCHCTHLEYPKEPIQSGESTTLTAYLNVAELSPGRFSRTIDILPAGSANKVTLILSGTVEE